MILQPVQTTRNINRFNALSYNNNNTTTTYNNLYANGCGGSQSHNRHNSTNNGGGQRQINLLNQNNQTQQSPNTHELKQNPMRNQNIITDNNSSMRPNQNMLNTVLDQNSTTAVNNININVQSELHYNYQNPQQYLPNIKRNLQLQTQQQNKSINQSHNQSSLLKQDSTTVKASQNITRKNETDLLFKQLKDNRKELLRNHRQLLSLQKHNQQSQGKQQQYQQQFQQQNNYRVYTSVSTHTNKTNLSQTAHESIVQELLKINNRHIKTYTSTQNDRKQQSQKQQHKNKAQILKEYSMSIRNSYDSKTKLETVSSEQLESDSRNLTQTIQNTNSFKQDIHDYISNPSDQKLIQLSQQQNNHLIMMKDLRESNNFKIQSQNQQRALSLLFTSYKSNLNQKYRNEIRQTLQTALTTTRSNQLQHQQQQQWQQQQQYSSQSPTSQSIRNSKRIQQQDQIPQSINKINVKSRLQGQNNTEQSPSFNQSTMRTTEQSQRRVIKNQKQSQENNANNMYIKQNTSIINTSNNNVNHSFNESLNILQNQQEQFRRHHVRTSSITSTKTANSNNKQKFVKPIKDNNINKAEVKHKSQLLVPEQSLEYSSLLISSAQDINDHSTNMNNNNILTTQVTNATVVDGPPKNENIISNNVQFFLTETGATTLVQNINNHDNIDDVNIHNQKPLTQDNGETPKSLPLQLSHTQTMTFNSKLQKLKGNRNNQQVNKSMINDLTQQLNKEYSNSPTPKTKVKFYSKENGNSFNSNSNNFQIGFRRKRTSSKIQQENESKVNDNVQNQEHRFMKLMKFDLDEEFNKIQRMIYKPKKQHTQNVNSISINDDSGRSRHKTTQATSRRVRFDIQVQQQPLQQNQQISYKMPQPET